MLTHNQQIQTFVQGKDIEINLFLTTSITWSIQVPGYLWLCQSGEGVKECSRASKPRSLEGWSNSGLNLTHCSVCCQEANPSCTSPAARLAPATNHLYKDSQSPLTHISNRWAEPWNLGIPPRNVHNPLYPRNQWQCTQCTLAPGTFFWRTQPSGKISNGNLP